MRRPPAPPASLLLGLLWAGVCAAFAARVWGEAPDDFFITFRYAWNLAAGEGFVFNPGERVFGTTEPGIGLLLGGLHALSGVAIHHLATVVHALAAWLVTWSLWREGAGRGEAVTAAAGGTLFLASSYFWVVHGGGTAPAMALLAFAARAQRSHPASAGAMAGAAVWMRPDAALGALALLALVWWGERRLPWRVVLSWALVVLLGAALAWGWFGSPLPNTLTAKQAMAAAREASWSGARFWARLPPLLARHWGSGSLLVVAAGVAGFWPLVARGGLAMRTLAAYGAGVAVAYPLLGVPFFPWYAVPPLAVVLYGTAALAVVAARTVMAPWRQAHPRRAAWSAAGLAGALLAVLHLPLLRASGGWFARYAGAGRYATYGEAGRWIRGHSAPEQRIAFGEIGQLAYFSERPVDDLMGLVTPEVLPYVQAGDGVGAFLRLAPDFFIRHPHGPHGTITETAWFRRAYRQVAEVSAPGDGESAVVYRRRRWASLPPAGPPRHAVPAAPR